MTTGIEFDDVLMMVGFVAEFEERDVAREYGYVWADWQELDTRERAANVAHSRLRAAIDRHAADAVQHDHERRARSGKHRRGS